MTYSIFSNSHNEVLLYCLENVKKEVGTIPRPLKPGETKEQPMFTDNDYEAEQKKIAARDGLQEDEIFCYGNPYTGKIAYFTAKQTDREIFTALLRDRSVFRFVTSAIWYIVYQRMGRGLGARPFCQDTRKDIIRTLSGVLKEAYNRPFIPLYRDEVGDVYKQVVRFGIHQYHNPVNKSDEKFSEADIGIILAESGLVCIRDEFSDLPEKDILIYQPPDSRFSTKKTAYTWEPLPVKLDNKGGEIKTGMYRDIVIMLNEKAGIDKIERYLYAAPRVTHHFSRKTVFFNNGVLLLENNGKSGRLIPWEEVEDKHYMESDYMPISFKLSVDFPVDRWDEKDPMLEQPVITLPAEDNLSERTMTPLEFVSEIFDPESEWKNYDNKTRNGLQISERVYAFLLFFRTFLQPYSLWKRMLFLVDSSGVATGGNAKNTVLKLISLLLTGNENPPAGGTIEAADLEQLTNKSNQFRLSRFRSTTHLWFSSENTDSFLDNLTIIKALVTGDTVPQEIKYDTPGNGRFVMSMIHCFNSLPNFSSVEFSTMRRIEVLYTPNNFTRSGRERRNVDEVFIKDPVVLSWLCYYSLRLFGGIEKIPSDLPVFVKNKADFTREVSRVQQFVKEVMEDKPEYLCNDIYTLDDLYVVFKLWYKSNIREKGDPPKFEQFLKQAADYIESHVPEWSIMIPKKGEERRQKKVSMRAAIGKPENFVYEYRKEFADNQNPFLSFRSEAVKSVSKRDGIGKGNKGNITRRDILQNWDYLSDMSIEELCTLESRFICGKHCKRGEKIIYRNQDYLGTGKFYHSSLRGYRSTKDGTIWNIYDDEKTGTENCR